MLSIWLSSLGLYIFPWRSERTGLEYKSGSNVIVCYLQHNKFNKASIRVGPAQWVDLVCKQSLTASNATVGFYTFLAHTKLWWKSQLWRKGKEDAELRAHTCNFQVYKKLTLSSVSLQLNSLELLNLVRQLSQRTELFGLEETWKFLIASFSHLHHLGHCLRGCSDLDAFCTVPLKLYCMFYI